MKKEETERENEEKIGNREIEGRTMKEKNRCMELNEERTISEFEILTYVTL